MGYYTGKIKVVSPTLQCFPVHPRTLRALACGSYDPWAWSDPEPDPIETIDTGEWQRRLNEREGKQP